MSTKQKGEQEQKSLINENNQLKYAQQHHLENERTYLTWIRTVVSIVGIGFLTTSSILLLG
ncbi:DUF202 domain-containing protein [Metabacillus sp. YM-086]|uniref:DUF202 domain-containing protein n=1 Tax=Metabacillus sp. YM-086 TaxID=3341729 RepID=UPI003A83DAD7